MTDRFGRTDQEHHQNTYDFETRYRFTPRETLTLNIGTNFRHILHSSNILTSRTAENRLGLYAQGDWLVLPSLEMSVGLRYDLDTFISPTLSPRGAIVYHLNSNHALRLTSSLAYRPPTTAEARLNVPNHLILPELPPMTTVALARLPLFAPEIVRFLASVSTNALICQRRNSHTAL